MSTEKILREVVGNQLIDLMLEWKNDYENYNKGIDKFNKIIDYVMSLATTVEEEKPRGIIIDPKPITFKIGKAETAEGFEGTAQDYIKKIAEEKYPHIITPTGSSDHSVYADANKIVKLQAQAYTAGATDMLEVMGGFHIWVNENCFKSIDYWYFKKDSLLSVQERVFYTDKKLIELYFETINK